MNVTIKINCDNAAFCDVPYEELSRILADLAERIQSSQKIEEQSIRDFNGNDVGNIEIDN